MENELRVEFFNMLHLAFLSFMPPAGNKTIIKENFSSAIHDVKFYKMEKQLGSRGRYIAARSLWQAGIKFCIIF